VLGWFVVGLVLARPAAAQTVQVADLIGQWATPGEKVPKLAFGPDSTFTIFDVGTAQTPDGKRSLRVVGRWRLIGDTLVYLDPVVMAGHRTVKAADGREVFGGDLTRLVTIRHERLTSRLRDATQTWVYERIVPSAASTPTQTTSGCRPADTRYVPRRLSYFHDLLTTTDPARVPVRDSLQLAGVKASQIKLVTTTSICTRAVSALNAQRQEPGKVRQVWVYTLGSNYAVEDPADQEPGQDRLIYLFSNSHVDKSTLAQ
jgi:hypothetical protein